MHNEPRVLFRFSGVLFLFYSFNNFFYDFVPPKIWSKNMSSLLYLILYSRLVNSMVSSGGTLALFIPDTIGFPLPDTLDDLEVPYVQEVMYNFHSSHTMSKWTS